MIFSKSIIESEEINDGLMADLTMKYSELYILRLYLTLLKVTKKILSKVAIHISFLRSSYICIVV
ncbi:MAG: hypothetical protein RBT45_07605 [Acholeplasmataceae bacterium]|nr:hypothetical protein [Acholeplasmataceae bacterium]